jgi:hypothetical protein
VKKLMSSEYIRSMAKTTLSPSTKQPAHHRTLERPERRSQAGETVKEYPKNRKMEGENRAEEKDEETPL